MFFFHFGMFLGLICPEKWVASFHDVLVSRGASWEVIDDLHSVELEKKVRLPDPSKAMEAVWKMLRRTKQQVDLTRVPGKVAAARSSNAVLSEKKRARVEADRRKAQGTIYAMRRTIR